MKRAISGFGGSLDKLGMEDVALSQQGWSTAILGLSTDRCKGAMFGAMTLSVQYLSSLLHS